MLNLKYLSAALIFAPVMAHAQVMDLTSQALPQAGTGALMDGNFPAMASPGPVVGDFIQDAWTEAPAGAGVKSQLFNPYDTVRVQLRSGMITTIIVPNGETIADFALGDQENFGTKPIDRQPNKLWVWVKNPGFDTNLNIIGRSGAVYSFYLRGETPNTKNITQQVVRLNGATPTVTEEEKQPVQAASAGYSPNASAQKTISALGDNMPDLKPEYLEKGCIFDPTKIRLDRTMHGEKSDEEIAPVQVLRDDCFTYLDFGEGADAKSWPGVWQVVDGVDEPVAFDPSKDGRFMVIYSTKPLSLKDGKKVVCILPPEAA